MARPYPLQFEPILKQKVWGGHRLAQLGRTIPPAQLIGESWEIADLASTSPGGGGGDAARSVIANGPLAGKTLHDAIHRWGSDLLGATAPASDGGFPLLVKFLDARENLSIQVHPSPEFARAHPDAHLKTEAWVVVDGEPGSTIYAGLRAGVTYKDLESALRVDSAGGVVNLLERFEAIPGACHLLPSGTIHALGAGVLVLEIQTPSDTTFRVYDWVEEYARSRRELHIDEALACAVIGPAPGPTSLSHSAICERLCKTPHFDIWSYNLSTGGDMALDWAPARAVGIACLFGKLQIQPAADEPLTLAPGGIALIPASISPECRVVAIEPARAIGFGVG